MTPEERAHEAYLGILDELGAFELQHAIEARIHKAIRAAVAAERAGLLQVIASAAAHLPGRPDLAERVLSQVLEEGRKL